MKYVRYISVTISESFLTVKCLTGARLMTLSRCISESIRTVCFISTSRICACATLHFIANFTTVLDWHKFSHLTQTNPLNIFFHYIRYIFWGCLWAIFPSPESDIQPVFTILDSLCSLGGLMTVGWLYMSLTAATVMLQQSQYITVLSIGQSTR